MMLHVQNAVSVSRRALSGRTGGSGQGGLLMLTLRDEDYARHGAELEGMLGARLGPVRLEHLASRGIGTSIYDPRHRLATAYRTLFEQWRQAFEIGDLNQRAGASVEPPGTLLRRIVAWTAESHA